MTARPARASDRQRRPEAALRILCRCAGIAGAAHAAAAADTLREHPKGVLAKCRHQPFVGDGDGATRAAGTAGAADRHCERYGDAVLRTGRIRRRRAVTTVAAATTDRLRHDPDRAIAGCGDQPRIAEPDGAGGVAGAALAADRGRERDGRDLRVARDIDRTRRRDSAIAAATADAVNIDAVGVRPIGRDLPLVDDGNIASRATVPALAADRDRRGRNDAANVERNRRTTLAAAAANRLGLDPGSVITVAGDQSRVGDIHRAANATRARVAADRQQQQSGALQGRTAAGTARTADALRQDTRAAERVGSSGWSKRTRPPPGSA